MQDADVDEQRRLKVVSALLNFMNGFADDMAFAQPATWLCPSLDHLCYGNRCDHLASVEMSYAAAKDRCERVGRKLDDMMALPPFNIPRGKTARQSMLYLHLHGRGLDDSSMKHLALFLASGALASCQKLFLTKNQIGDSGVEALAQACAGGALASVTILALSSNKIGDKGLEALSGALATGALPSLKKIVVDTRHERHPQLMAACKPRGIEIA